jgi:hypothetical protein
MVTMLSDASATPSLLRTAISAVIFPSRGGGSACDLAALIGAKLLGPRSPPSLAPKPAQRHGCGVLVPDRSSISGRCGFINGFRNLAERDSQCLDGSGSGIIRTAFAARTSDHDGLLRLVPTWGAVAQVARPVKQRVISTCVTTGSSMRPAACVQGHPAIFGKSRCRMWRPAHGRCRGTEHLRLSAFICG